MSSIPEDAAAAIGEAMARSSVSFVLPTVQTTTGPQAPSLRTPTLRSVTHAVTAAMSMASGAGEGSLFLTSRVSAGVAVVGKVIDGKLTKRPSYEAVRRLLRVSGSRSVSFVLHLLTDCGFSRRRSRYTLDLSVSWVSLPAKMNQQQLQRIQRAALSSTRLMCLREPRTGRQSDIHTPILRSELMSVSCQVFSRYSELSALHDLLRHNCPSFKGAFPPKHSFLGEDSKFMEARRVGLGRWLDVSDQHCRNARQLCTLLVVCCSGGDAEPIHTLCV